MNGKIAAWALFICEGSEAERPYLRGAFDNLEEAKAALAIEGAISG
jgi:hypothetical protein